MKIILMQGLPASGKSTRAKELLQHGNTVRINRDLLRTMLHCDKWSGRNEGVTKDASRHLADYLLGKGLSVIIDDTNLNEGTIQSWRELAAHHKATLQYERMKTDVAECLDRDWKREKRVGAHVIMGMALQHGLYPKPEKGIVLCDLDGTLCDIKHRLHFVKNLPEGQKKDWRSFFAGIAADGLRQEVFDMVFKYHTDGHEVFFVSARPEDHRKPTELWLQGKAVGFHKALFMRPARDTREDTLVKAEMFDKYFKNLPVEAVIDDRPSVIRMWREKGLNVIDVGSGVEF